ncbi:PIG-L deacetylase family protein [Psychrobacter sp. Sarcosine-3u-12]|uniref:PIG-L deacetylase family protein n=1 Tax=Psychrobacter sp. Sarcosine-3u-12 TaxID=2058325 RepID=UPI000C34FAF8|nr:PIG-L deacetylase family protein [Psychrobacter sp. Sarcosine-3u-12]PKG35492.1 LmbE-like protein [Psychrobacter sp. Sarcosine-3u-12]
MATIVSINTTKLIPKDDAVANAAIFEGNHPIVGDRVIEGDGTSQEAWQNWVGLQDLPRFDIAKSFAPHQRVCIFAPHPDDEVLGCGGLLQQLAANGNPIVLIHVTNGTQSHPNSQIYSQESLDTIRPQESVKALEVLGVANQVTTMALNLADGNVFAQQDQFHQELSAIIQPEDILITTFINDGHPDHEATGQVVASFAKQQHLACYQVLIWAWHWAKPGDSRIPWHCAMRINLTTEQLQRKLQAITCFKSQITADDSTGSPPILSAKAIARISQPWEVYLYESHP